MNNETVVVKLQRPLATNGVTNVILAYVVNDDDEQISNDIQITMKLHDIDYLFGEHYKVYWTAHTRRDGLLNILEPVKKEDWV